MDRRDFLQGASAALVAGSLPSFAERQASPGSDAVRIGVIGPGSRGQELMRQFLRVPGARITAVCDVYEPRFEQVDALAGERVPRHRDYRELLARTDLDAIVVATPLYLHAEHVVAALKSGRPVYGEKSMGFTPDDCRNILAAQQASGHAYQVGHQYRYSQWFRQAIDEIHKGRIGNVTHIYAYWHRNNDWRRPVPNPKDERLINWRLYREYSGGLLTELGAHHIDVANWTFQGTPEAVLGTGSIAQYHDGREVNDNVQVIFHYAQGKRLVFSSVTSNSIVGEQLWIYGTDGSAQITLEDATFYYEPKKPQPVSEHSSVIEHGVTTGASYRAQGEMPYRGQGERVQVGTTEDPTLTACRSFVQCVREKTRPVADVHVGYASAMAAAFANRAIDSGRLEKLPLA